MRGKFCKTTFTRSPSPWKRKSNFTESITLSYFYYYYYYYCPFPLNQHVIFLTTGLPCVIRRPDTWTCGSLQTYWTRTKWKGRAARPWKEARSDCGADPPGNRSQKCTGNARTTVSSWSGRTAPRKNKVRNDVEYFFSKFFFNLFLERRDC